MRQHGGEIFAEDNPGGGTAFHICFPVVTDATADDDTPHGPAPPTASLTGARLLVVDDEPVIRAVVSRYLQQAGALTVEASSGEEALDLLERSEYGIDVVLTSHRSPRLGAMLQGPRRTQGVACFDS